ncbi:MAG: hypothetical protein ACE5MK_05940, partial [Acidobacteriota bacterium]
LDLLSHFPNANRRDPDSFLSDLPFQASAHARRAALVPTSPMSICTTPESPGATVSCSTKGDLQ